MPAVKQLQDRVSRLEGLEPAAPVVPLDFKTFLEAEFLPAVSLVEGGVVPAPHLLDWAKLIEVNRFTALIAFRGALKSTALKAAVARALRSHQAGAFDVVYYSAKLDLARWHLRRLKAYLRPLAAAWGWTDDTPAEGILRFRRRGATFTCEPEGLDAASRGRRADLLVIDDPADPKKLASMADVDRVLEALQRRVLPLLKDATARVVFASTPIVEGDVVTWIRGNPEFATAWLPAIKPDGQPAWPEKFPLEELDRLRALLGTKAFKSEFMLEAVAPMATFIDAELLARAVVNV